MSFIVEEDSVPIKQVNSLWVEKYRPKNLDEYIGNEQFKESVKGFIERKDIPHLLLYGPAGTGKTSAAKLITKHIPCDVMYINASDETGVDTVRNKIRGFASTSGFNPMKIIILDEFDFMTGNSQAALRSIMETFSLTTKFILTCNYHEKIIPPIVSRCQTYQINPISKKEIAIHLKSILDREKIVHTNDDLGYIINTYYPDIRKVINFSQQSCLDGKIKISKHDTVQNDIKLKMLEMLQSGSKFNEIRQLITDADIKHFDEFYSFLYERTKDYAKGKDVIAILTIAEYMYQSAMVVDKEITFMACISKLIQELK